MLTNLTANALLRQISVALLGGYAFCVAAEIRRDRADEESCATCHGASAAVARMASGEPQSWGSRSFRDGRWWRQFLKVDLLGRAVRCHVRSTRHQSRLNNCYESADVDELIERFDELFEPVSEDLYQLDGHPVRGLRRGEKPCSAALRLGINRGDILLEVDGAPVETIAVAVAALDRARGASRSLRSKWAADRCFLTHSWNIRP